ncbi:DUF58 domain-containing protein [Albirhodobacter sp. R86504]|uniref:DUF58 domain-containing protein n=1 Tax=Albirhodobacter sp. R86504 TaxID=3093848 RepID=UPI00366C6257
MTQSGDPLAASGASAAVELRGKAETLSSGLPPLMLSAMALADTVRMGAHGRRRIGAGTEFWQYRPAEAGDGARLIDWRRSARADAQVVREREWQLAQSAWVWVDPATSMRFSAGDDRPQKAHRAAVLGLAMAVLLIRAGERVGLLGQTPLAARGGRAQIESLSAAMSPEGEAGLLQTRAGGLDTGEVPPHAEVIVISDFLADPAPVEAQIALLAARGVRGVLMQVLDPVEEDFPYRGRAIFESVGDDLNFESADAADLRPRYLARLAERRERISAAAHAAGWHFGTHHTGEPAQSALLWMAGALQTSAASSVAPR